MLNKVSNYDSSHPTFKVSKNYIKWSRLFLFDLAFGLTNKSKSEKGNTLKKFEGNTRMGQKLNDTHQKNVSIVVDANSSFQYDKALDLPSIEAKDFNAKEFSSWRFDVGMPLVIKGYLNDAPILDLMSLDKLKAEHGEKEIKCTTVPSDKDKESRVGQNLSSVTTSLAEFLDSDKFKDHYINNFFGILNDSDFLELCKGKEIDSIMKSSNILTQWFISRTEGSGSTLHCASADNMFLNISGKKEWYFIDPSYTPIMRPAMSKHGVFCVSEMEETLEGDFYEELLKKYPYMGKVPIYRTVLEPGDLLFNPPWWWHRVKNLSPFTVGCATRYWEAKKSWGNSKTFTVGMQFESIKNPKKSPILLSIKSLLKKDNAKDYIDSIFSKDS